MRGISPFVGLAVVLCGCPREQARVIDAEVIAVAPDAGREHIAIDPDAGSVARSGPLVEVVDVKLPEGLELRVASAERLEIYVSGSCPGTDEWSRRSCVMVVLERARVRAWRTLDEATKSWDSWGGRDGTRPIKKLGEGTMPTGVLYAIRSFEVRIGLPGIQGQTIHTYAEVSRVYAALPIDDASHVDCTGYIERSATNADDPAIAAVRGICTSMRLR